MSTLMIPLMIAGGFDGVEPFARTPVEIIASDGRRVTVREAARMIGSSSSHVFYIMHGERKAHRLRAKMRELGLKFKEGKWVNRESEENFRSPLPDARVCAGSSRPCESARHGAAGEADEGREVR